MERVERAPRVLARGARAEREAMPLTRLVPLALAPLLLRLALGSVFFAHGAQKLLGVFGGPGLGGAAQGFAAWGLPAPTFLAVVSALLEFGGGLLLFAGLWTRQVSALLGFEMLFALFAVHAPNGFFLNWSGTGGAGHGMEYALVLVASLASLVLTGAGRFSVDRELRVRRRRATERKAVERERERTSVPPT